MESKLSTSDVVRMIAHKTDQPVREITKTIEALVDVVTIALRSGEPVAIRHLGRFAIRHYRESVRVNPNTREKMEIGPRRSVGFVPSETLRKEMNGE